MAMAIQRYIMEQVEKKNYRAKSIENLSIPYHKVLQPLLNNQFYLKNLLENNVTDKMCEEMDKIYALNNSNPFVAYNQAICIVNGSSFSSINDINLLQTQIDRLYTFPILPRERINSLNLELQFKVIDFLEKETPTNEITALLNTTYEKIKAIRNPKLDSWQNAYKLASYFVKNQDYDYALSLMDPFLTAPDLSDDFVFSYVSISGYREDSYLSGNFTYAIEMAAKRDRTRFCNLIEKMSISISDNLEVKKVICKQCK